MTKETMNNPPQDAQAFAKWLNDQGACILALKWQHGKTLCETWNCCKLGDWLEWLLSKCGYQWTAPAWAEYERVMAPAWAERERVRAAAWAEYERVRAAAWAEYERVRVDAIRTIVPYPFK